MAPKTKSTKKTETPVVEKTPVVAEAPKETNVVQVAGATKKSNKKNAASVAAAPVVAEPVVVTPVEAAPVAAPVKKTATKKSTPAKGVAMTEVVAVEKPAKTVTKATKKTEKVTPVEATADEEEHGEEDSKTRSFKVRLPGDESFSGRFTGLTPYQAANKALSKYFRGLENSSEGDVQVNFSIKESTRGSKRHEYTYKGSRLKLEKPITYTIKSTTGEERVITKQYKNQLIKVKKSVTKQESVVV